jgi:hypothetical protein
MMARLDSITNRIFCSQGELGYEPKKKLQVNIGRATFCVSTRSVSGEAPPSILQPHLLISPMHKMAFLFRSKDQQSETISSTLRLICNIMKTLTRPIEGARTTHTQLARAQKCGSPRTLAEI